MPSKILHCDEEARPGYASVKAHEFDENEDVLAAKIKLLGAMIRSSANCIAYTGAGISTGAGIGDYASRSAGAASATASLRKVANSYSAQPTLAHYCLSDLYFAGHLKWWCQQNHDGLPQKAGMPQHVVNEIHGAWWDPSNPVVKMDGNLRDDLFEELLLWERNADLCLAIGTSLSGMNADRLVETTAAAAMKRRNKKKSADRSFLGGSVIIGIQCTRLDSVAALRIYANIDKVMGMLAEEMQLTSDKRLEYGVHVRDLMRRSQECSGRDDIYCIKGYDSASGQLVRHRNRNCKSSGKSDQECYTILNLTENSKVRLVHGPRAGAIGIIQGKTKGGHYDVLFQVPAPRRENSATSNEEQRVGQLQSMPWRTRIGLWMIVAALEGNLPILPIVNA